MIFIQAKRYMISKKLAKICMFLCEKKSTEYKYVFKQQ